MTQEKSRLEPKYEEAFIFGMIQEESRVTGIVDVGSQLDAINKRDIEWRAKNIVASRTRPETESHASPLSIVFPLAKYGVILTAIACVIAYIVRVSAAIIFATVSAVEAWIMANTGIAAAVAFGIVAVAVVCSARSDARIADNAPTQVQPSINVTVNVAGQNVSNGAK